MTAEVAAAPVTVTEPGVYDAMPAETYHADPVPGGSLSCSWAKKLLPPSCPAIFRWQRDHGEPPRDVFDFGTAAHRKVLGVGADIEVVLKTAKDGTRVSADDYKTKSAQEHRDEIRAAGRVPLLASDVEVIDAMAAKLREHPTASALLNPERGKPEQALFWRDQRFDVMRRALVDFLPGQVTGRRALVVDYKTAIAVDREAIGRAVVNYGYDIQGDWYLDGVRSLGLDDDPAFLLIFQMKTPPYLVTVAQLPADALRRGRRLSEDALSTYVECTRTGQWPGFVPDDEVALIDLPAWAA